MKEHSSLSVSILVKELMKTISSGFKVISFTYIISGHLHLQKKRRGEKQTELEAW